MQPCIFLKLNKIFDWEPEYYEDDDKLPENMPEDLQKHIKLANSPKEVVWVSCEGEYPADKEHIGTLKYYTPQGFQGFNGNFYPYSMQTGYKQPLVAVQFTSATSEYIGRAFFLVGFGVNACLTFTEGMIINVECKAWAKNIVHDRTDRRGSVHLEVMIDNKAYDGNYNFNPKK